MKSKSIKIYISKIKVDSKYFSFKFSVFVNEKLFESDNYDSSHEWSSKYKQKKFKEILKNHYAYDIVLENLKSLESYTRLSG